MNMRQVEKFMSEKLNERPSGDALFTPMGALIVSILAIPVLGVGWLGLRLGGLIEPSDWVFGPVVLLGGFLCLAAGVVWYANLEGDTKDLPGSLRGLAPSLVCAMVLGFTFAVITPAMLTVIGNAVGSIVPGEDSAKVIIANLALVVILLALVVAVPWIGIPLLIILLMGIAAS